MIYFTSDWHINDNRIGLDDSPNIMMRDFESVITMNESILSILERSGFKDGDTLYHLGDVIYKVNTDIVQPLYSIRARYPNSKFILVEGNYDIDSSSKDILIDYLFDEVVQELYLELSGIRYYMNHYPTKALSKVRSGEADFGVVGHIHSTWKVQSDLVNVGVDCWNFKLVSENDLRFIYNAVKKHYDKEVFLYN